MLGLKFWTKPETNQLKLDHEFLWTAAQVADYTPDISLLQEHEYQNVFIVDDMKRGFDVHWMLQPHMAAGHGTAFTKDNFLFYRKDFIANTIAVPREWNPNEPESSLPWVPKPSPIKGEVYSIKPEAFLLLDRYRLNGVQFDRKRVKLIKHYNEIKKLEWLTGHTRFSIGALSRAELALNLPDNAAVRLGDRQEVEFHAWMYVARGSYWDEQLECANYHGFQPVQQFVPRDPECGITRYSTLTKDATVESEHFPFIKDR